MATKHLQNERLRISVSPARGGGLLRFDARRGDEWLPLFRPCADEAGSEPDQLACYPLVPWSNRIGGGHFGFEGVQYRVPLTRDDEPLPIHGHGWLAHWEVINVGADEIRLTHAWRGADPFSYTASLRYTLEPTALRITLRVGNLGRRLPFGLGLHPFLPREPRVRLCAPARGWWHAGPDHLPDELRRPVPAAYDFARARPLDDAPPIHHAYAGWSGAARIDFPRARLALEMTADVDHLVIHAPPGRDFFCVQPVDHPINALNLPHAQQGGLTVLEAGASLERHFRFAVGELEASHG